MPVRKSTDPMIAIVIATTLADCDRDSAARPLNGLSVILKGIKGVSVKLSPGSDEARSPQYTPGAIASLWPGTHESV